MHLTSLMGPLSWPQPRRTLAYEMPIRTARFLPREHGKAPMGAAGLVIAGGSGIREDKDRRMRVTPQHCVHWTARSPGHTVRHALQYLHRIVVVAAAGVLPPMFMAIQATSRPSCYALLASSELPRSVSLLLAIRLLRSSPLYSKGNYCYQMLLPKIVPFFFFFSKDADI